MTGPARPGSPGDGPRPLTGGHGAAKRTAAPGRPAMVRWAEPHGPVKITTDPMNRGIFPVAVMQFSSGFRRATGSVFATLILLVARPALAQTLELDRGSRISIIGNTLAERMQHDGWLESMMHAGLNRDLVIRNLGFSGDELTTRLRSKDFGTPDEWMKRLQTDIVFAFFGYNESFADEAGLEAFEKELTEFIIRTRTQKYNGDRPPVLVLFSPIACEDLQRKIPEPNDAGMAAVNPNLPDMADHNRRLGLYTEAMRKVADNEEIIFVDLFTPTRQLWEASDDQFTINGVHLNERGNRQLAAIICKQLFGGLDPERNLPGRVREAVLDKNWYWFHRYRTTDGYSIYGGRADLAFTDGQTNREVAQRELEILDYLTAERDKRIHALCGGSDYTPDDAGAPPLIPVISNKPGGGPNGTHQFLTGEEAIEKMDVHPGMSVNLFASEEQFPELASPVQMSFDPRGRLWVAAWPGYPHWQPTVAEMNDKLLIFTDTDQDGVADEMTVFADRLHNPTGFEFWNGGVVVAQAPDLWFLKDTDGDDVADLRMRILHGIDSADTHHTSNSFTYGPDGALYFQEGTFHHSQIESPWGPPLRMVNAGVFRYEPRTQKIDSYVTYGFANPHGHVFDYWGQDFVTDGTGNVNYYVAPFSGHLEYPRKHSSYFPFFEQWVRPAGATEILSSGQFPEEFQGNYLIANVIGFQGLLQYEVHEDGSGFSATEVKPIVSSTDPNFRPVDIEMGPDGAIYFVDWQNPIIGHMQHNLRDPNRDKIHGRVYRVTWNERPLDPPGDLARMTVPQLLEQLKSPGNRVRYRTRLELSSRPTNETLAAVRKWVAELDPADPALQHHLLEALWVTRQHNATDESLLRRLLRSPEPRARAAAVRVLCYSREQVQEVMPLLQAAVNDPFPRVRLEAVRALSFIPTAMSAEIALQVLAHPRDRFIDYCLNETLRSSETEWRQLIASGQPFADDNEAGLRFLMDKLSPAEVAGMARNPVVFNELLTRPAILHEWRMEAAAGLAQRNRTDARTELLAAIGRLDASEDADADNVLADLTHLFLHGDGRSPHVPDRDGVDYSPYLPRLQQLAATARKPITRQIAYATLIEAGQSLDQLWSEASQSPAQFGDLVAAMALVDDADVKTVLAPRVAGLFEELPPPVTAAIENQPATAGRYVRIELPGEQRTLTLAEVQIFSGGRNLAPAGTASQSTVAHGGGPEKAIDGDTNPVFGAGSQTHTNENQADPWWEIDLGRDYPIDKVVIWNRQEGELGQRLDGFTLRVLDEKRHDVFVQPGNAAPPRQIEVPLSGDPGAAIRDAAIAAAVHLSPGDRQTFADLAKLILGNLSRSQAVRGLSRLPRRSWIDEQIEPLVQNMIDHLGSLSAAQRTLPYALDEISLARKLNTVLPEDAAARFQSRLNDLGVNVVILRPIPHRMQYDRTQFFVEAGKPFQLVLDNTDIMPHNVVIATPGSYAKVGIAAELLATEPGAARRGYVPDLPEVLHASRMLQPGQVQQMQLVAPEQPGEYPYLCTYPGHWRRMYGVMHVVEDLGEAPIEALAPTIDSEVASRPFVREWTSAELLTALGGSAGQRSFQRGRALFTELSCIQCHRMKQEPGGEVGPNMQTVLEKLSKGDLDRAGLVKSLVEPSAEIAEEFRTWIVQDIEGRVYTGVVAERGEESIRILANPLDNGQAVTIPVDDIEEEIESKISLMPQGLLNTCSEPEILDLLRFIETGGDPQHPAWSK